MGFKNERNKLLILIGDLEGFEGNDEAETLLKEVKSLLIAVRRANKLSSAEQAKFQKELGAKIEELQNDFSGIYDSMPYYEKM